MRRAFAGWRPGKPIIASRTRCKSWRAARAARREQSDSARRTLDLIGVKVQMLAELHDFLQKASADGDTDVDLAPLLRDLCAAMAAFASGGSCTVQIKFEAQPLRTSAPHARLLLLAVNELVVNALRHAFADGARGTIHVSAKIEAGLLSVIVADDGVGLPEGALDGGGGYGAMLVNGVAEELGGRLLVGSGPGARVEIVAPAPRRSFRPDA